MDEEIADNTLEIKGNSTERQFKALGKIWENLQPSKGELKIMIKPRKNYLLVREHPTGERRTAAGLYIPDMNQSPNRIGTVVAVGPGNLQGDGTRSRVDAKVNDVVMYSIHSAGNKVPADDGTELIMLTDDQLLANVE